MFRNNYTGFSGFRCSVVQFQDFEKRELHYRKCETKTNHSTTLKIQIIGALHGKMNGVFYLHEGICKLEETISNWKKLNIWRYSSLSNAKQSLGLIVEFTNFQIMSVNSTTIAPSGPTNSSDATGLAVGLTFFFLLLLIVPGVIVYKYHSKIRNMGQFGKRRSQKKEDYSEATQDDDSHRYSSMYTEQPMAQTPIYENLTRTSSYNSPAISQSR